MKKILAMFVALFATVSMYAQDGALYVMPRVAYSVGDLAGMDDFTGKRGFAAGVDVQYFLSDKFAISAGALYSQQGAEMDVTWFPSEPKAFTVKDDLSLNYLNIPLMAQYYVYKGLALKAGVQAGVLLSAKRKGSHPNSYFTETLSFNDDIKEACEKVDLAIPVGLSYDFGNFVIDARYNIGLTGVFKEDYSLDLVVGDPTKPIPVEQIKKSAKNNVFQLSVAYKFAL